MFKDKKNLLIAALSFIIALLVIIILVVVLKGNLKPYEVLMHVSENMEDITNMTIDAEMSMKSGETDLDFKASILMDVKEDNVKAHISVPKTLLYDDMNAYVVANDKKVKLYTLSNVIDLIGYTYSENPIWVNYEMDASEIDEALEVSEDENLDFEEIYDEKHFYYVDKEKNISHYELLIDEELLNKIDKESAKEFNETFKEPLKVQIYINTKTYFIDRIEMDLTKYINEMEEMENVELDGLNIVISLKDLNSTKIEIPDAALKNSINLETYMEKYISYELYE